MKQWQLFLVVFSLLYSTSALSQVATPPMDPSAQFWMGAAVGWTPSMFIDLANGYSTGKQHDSAGVTTHKYKTQSTKAQMALRWQDLHLQGWSDQSTEKDNLVSKGTTSQSVTFTAKEAAAYLIEKVVSVGGWSDKSGYPVGLNGVGLGVSLKLGSNMFFGWGKARNWDSVYKWETNYGGIGLYKPHSYRVEYSEKRSDTATSGVNTKIGERETKVSFETFTGHLLWGVNTGTVVQNTGFTSRKNQEISAAWHPPKGFGFTFAQGKTEYVNSQSWNYSRISVALFF